VDFHEIWENVDYEIEKIQLNFGSDLEHITGYFIIFTVVD